MSRYPFNEAREQVDQDHCPAPFCGRSLRMERAWLTAIMFKEDVRRSFADVAAEARPLDSYRCSRMVTCRRGACTTWARLRAEDLRGGPHLDRMRLDATRHPRLPEHMAQARAAVMMLHELQDLVRGAIKRRGQA